MEVECPKCGSNQITANKQGFSGKKAVAGALLTGGVGLLAGTIGSNKVRITCLACGNVFKPGEKPKLITTATPITAEQLKRNKKAAAVISPILLISGLLLVVNDVTFFGYLLMFIGFVFLSIAMKKTPQ
jgi:hypothetical protein